MILDYLFLIVIGAYSLVISLRAYQEFFRVRRNQDVDLIPLYIKLLLLRKKGIPNEAIRNAPRRW